MEDQKHFKYEININSNKNSKTEIKNVEFLTPARVTSSVDGKETSFMVSIDIINRKVYDSNGDTNLSEMIFKHIDTSNELPEDFFAAPPELSQKAQEVDAERKKRFEEILGDYKK